MPGYRTGDPQPWSDGMHRILRTAAGALATLCIVGAASAQERVAVASPEELLALFEKLDCTPETRQSGIRENSRIYLMDIGPTRSSDHDCQG